MKYRNVVVVWLSLLLLATVGHAQQPVKLIFDTDMDTDVDDAGALAMLHALADNGEVEILAAAVSSEFFRLQERGNNHIFGDGNNEWRLTPHRGNHVILELAVKPDAVARVIDHLMIQPPGLSPGLAVEPIGELAVSAVNPHYLAVNGEPVFLIGATHEGGWTPIARTNHDFQRDLDRLGEILDEIGSPHVRGLVRVIPYDPNNRPDDLPYIVQPWVQLPDGRFDLERFDPRWEQRLRAYLQAARQRGIVVGLEVWDDWSFTRGPRGPQDHPKRAWHGNPFNPANNINYTAEVLPPLADQCSQPFYLSLPALQNNLVLYRLQRLYVDHLLSIAGEYPNVLFNISNETRASLTWSRYWAEYLRERLGSAALIGDMPSTDRSGRRERTPQESPRRGGGECDPELNPWTLLRDPRYGFVDAAQAVNQHEFGPNPVEQSIRAGHRLAQYREEMAANGVAKPVVVSKDYTNTEPDGIPVIWAKFVGGAASTRFHRPSEGRGQVGPDSYLITDFNFEAIRHLGRFVATTQFWRMRPDPALVTASPAEGALALATTWDEYVVQLIGGRGPGELVLQVEPGSYWLRWYDPATGRYLEDGRSEGTRVDIAAAGPLRLAVPAYEQNLIMHLRKR